MYRDEMILVVVSWTLYGVGVCLVLSRILSRLITLRSPTKLQTDDWLMLFIVAPFTGIVLCTNAASPAYRIGRVDGKELVWSLKMRFTLEEFQITTNWLVKACLLILYWRIFPASSSKRQRRYLTYAAACCLLSFIAIQALLPVWCHPMHHYWSPTSINTQCTTYRNHSITTLALNTTTTIALFLLPIPYIPTPRTLLLLTLFVLGTVGSVAGVLGRYYVVHEPSSPRFLPWYIAETTTLIAYTNMPFLSSLFSSNSKIHRRYVSQTSLGTWPRSYKDARGGRERLGSTAEEAGMRSIPDLQERRPLDGESVKLVGSSEEGSEGRVAVPKVVVRQLSLKSPPPELGAYWTAKRVSVREIKPEEDIKEVRLSLR